MNGLKIWTIDELSKTNEQYKDLVVNKIFRPDENGYWMVNGGAFNVAVEIGGEYVSFPFKPAIFSEKTQIMDYLRKGSLGSEMGHPTMDPKFKFMTDNEKKIEMAVFKERIAKIDMKNQSGHIKNIFLIDIGKSDPRCLKASGNVILVVLHVKPEGPYKDQLESSLKNPDANTAYSVRAFGEPELIGKQKVQWINNIITYDQELRGAYDGATKQDSMDYSMLSKLVKGSMCVDGACKYSDVSLLSGDSIATAAEFQNGRSLEIIFS